MRKYIAAAMATAGLLLTGCGSGGSGGPSDAELQACWDDPACDPDLLSETGNGYASDPEPATAPAPETTPEPLQSDEMAASEEPARPADPVPWFQPDPALLTYCEYTVKYDVGYQIAEFMVYAQEDSTSCPFAISVADAYFAPGVGENATLSDVFNPTTGEYLSMFCTRWSGYDFSCTNGVTGESVLLVQTKRSVSGQDPAP